MRMREQPCWTCLNGDSVRKCPWVAGKPREDWTADETTVMGAHGQIVKSYKIKVCPGYECGIMPRVDGDNPTEAQEQSALVHWSEEMQQTFPALKMLVHIPNEGQRSPVTGARLRQQGMRKGFPDLFLPVASCGYNGLMIEMKRVKKSTTSDEQRWWLDALNKQGYRAEVCKGAVAAANLIIRYLLGNIDALE